MEKSPVNPNSLFINAFNGRIDKGLQVFSWARESSLAILDSHRAATLIILSYLIIEFEVPVISRNF